MNRIFFLLLCLTTNQLFGQNFLSWQFKDRYFSFSVGTGSSTYFGELNYKNTINDRFSQLNAAFEARLLNRVGARFDFAYLTLNGNDINAPDSSFQRQRNLSFNSRNFLIQLHGIYYFKDYQGDYYKRWTADPYIFSGVGYMRYQPTANLGPERLLLREAMTEGVAYNNWTITIPAGAGVKFKINEFSNFNVEVSYHFAFTDYLDDVSNTYASEFPNATAELLSDRKDEVGILNPEFYDQIGPGSLRGDPSTKDSFLMISLRLELYIPPELFSGKREPFIKKPVY